MKNLLFSVVLLILSFIAQLFLPWWVISILSFIVCYAVNPGKFLAFSGSMMAIFILWAVKAYVSEFNFDESISGLLGKILGNVSSNAVFFLTGLTGGLIAGLSGLLGTWTRDIIK